VVQLLAILRTDLGNSGLQMEYELDDIAGDTEKFLGPFRI